VARVVRRDPVPVSTPQHPIGPVTEMFLDAYIGADARPAAGTRFVSCLHALRRDARGATFRDLRTGKPRKDGPSPSWLGTIGYLVLVEQIGKAVLRLDAPAKPPGFDRALEHFAPSPLSKPERDALRSLRNAFAHDYGLVSRGRDDQRGGRYIFMLVPRAHPMVDLGAEKPVSWHHLRFQTATVGVIDLADYIEALIDRVLVEHANGNVTTDLAPDELGQRFTFWVNEV